MGTAIKHPVPDRVKQPFVIFDGHFDFSPERQSVQMSKITMTDVCFIAVSIWQQWPSNG